MDAQLKTNLTSPKHWVRLVYMVLFAFFLYLAAMVMIALVVVQFIFSLLTGRDNHKLRSFGFTLTTYIQQALLFLSFNSEFKPFPFADWPEATQDYQPDSEAAASGDVAASPVVASSYNASATTGPTASGAQHAQEKPADFQQPHGVAASEADATAPLGTEKVKGSEATANGVESNQKQNSAATAHSQLGSAEADAQAITGSSRAEGVSEVETSSAQDDAVTAGRSSETAGGGVAVGLSKAKGSSKAEGSSEKAASNTDEDAAHVKSSNKNASTHGDENKQPPLVDPEAEKKFLS